MAKLRIYGVSLKQGKERHYIKASNANNAINIFKNNIFPSYKGLKNHLFLAEAVMPQNIAKIEKTEKLGLYNVKYAKYQGWGNEQYIQRDVSLNKAKKIQKQEYLRALKKSSYRTGKKVGDFL